MLALRTRAVLNYLFGRQYAGIQDADINNLPSLDARAPVILTQTEMASRIVVVPDPVSTVVVTQYVPANNTQDVNSAALPPVATAPAENLPPPNDTPVVDGDAPQFASFIPPTNPEVNPVPTTVAGQEPPNGVPGSDENAPQFGTFLPVTSQEASPAPTAAPGQEPPNEVPVDGDAPQFATFIPTTSQEVSPAPTTAPGQEPPQEVPANNGDAPQFASFIPPTSEAVDPVPTTAPGQEPEPAPPAPLPETTSAVEPIPQPPAPEAPQETTPPIEPIAQPTSQPPLQETIEPTQPIDEPDPVTTDAQPPVQPTSQQAPQETPSDARLIDGPDPVTTDAQNPARPSAQPTTQGGPGNTPENARLIIETETESSFSLSATLTSEILQFDTASFTYTGPPSRSTTLQTRQGTSTDVSAGDSTETSDGSDSDDDETNVGGSEPLYTTATLADGVVTTIDLGATAGTGQSSETETPGAVVKDKSEEDAGATPVVVGSIVGSILGISMLALVIFWLIRRRKLQRRRSTLLTPLGVRPGAPPGTPGNLMKYEIDNQSLGPTPRSAKVAAAMSANAKKFSQRLRQSMSDASHINMSRGNSQFGHEGQVVPTPRAHSRASSTPPGLPQQNGWWSQAFEESIERDVPAAAPPMAQHGYVGRRTPSPNPFSDYNSAVGGPSATAREYSHSVPPHGSMVPQPLEPARPYAADDPFADGDSIMSPELARQSPTIYGGAVDQRRSPPMSRNLTPQSTGDNMNLRPQEVWRGKVHSNPFDLELDNRVVPSMYGNIQQVPRYTVASSFYSTANNNSNNNNRYTTRQSRADSFTSKYTSGVSSISEWPPVPPRVPSIYGRYGDDGTDLPVPPQHSRSDDNSWRR